MITYDTVTKIFGTGSHAITALDRVSFTINRGKLVVFLGPSGCGKTTLLRLTNRLDSPTGGTITVDGRDTAAIDPVALRQSMGYVIQDIGLFPNKTIAQNIAVVPRLLGWDKKRIAARTEELLAMVQLDPASFLDRYPAELSGGQQQRIGVARGLAADPEILLMDEPFGAIDPINREQIQNEFLRLQGRLKKTIAFVSHDIHEAMKLADRIALFADGRLVQYDTPEMILTRPRNRFVADFVGADRALKALALIRVEEAMQRPVAGVLPAATEAEEARRRLDEQQIDRAVVVRDDKPVGTVHARHLAGAGGPVAGLVEPLPVTATAHESLRDALAAMLMHDLALLCVIDDTGTLVGSLGFRDIQQAIVAIYAEERDDD